MRRTGSLALAVVVVAAAAVPARADRATPRRAIAVLEVREGSAELADVAARVGELIGKKTSLAVIGADAARSSYGDGFDADLIACAGQAACLAEMGTRLGVADVLLVGVSEFGDVILTLQRIEVAGGRVAGRIAEALAPGARPDDRALLGYLERVLPAEAFRRFGEVRIIADLAGASVRVGGVARGRTPLAPLRLAAPASYDILVEKPGYLEFRASVAVPPDAEVLVRPTLARRAEPRAWYEHWWVVAVAGGVAAGAITTAVLISRDDDNDVPVTIEPF